MKKGLTSVSTWILTFNWLSLYWFALETCSSIPQSTASQPVHLMEREGKKGKIVYKVQKTDNWVKNLHVSTDTQKWYWPLLQRIDYVRELIGAQVTADAAVDLHLLVPLVQFALDDVTVDSFNQEILQLPHILQLQLLQEQRVGQALREKYKIKTLFYLFSLHQDILAHNLILLYSLMGNGKKCVIVKLPICLNVTVRGRWESGHFNDPPMGN